MYPYQYDPRFQNLFPPGGGQGFPAFPPGGGGQGFPHRHLQVHRQLLHLHQS
ncbi:hypothetical protein [Priestia megaterium]|uniref:hypothetical protein n=1 Tax=Priestia megaterium TaxID=1404 RepID=UPI002E1A552E|nr:hypothetical protein [Priestia megaterium]MED4277381.1 hypothetical protein [Priestia megaterium]MED4317651.1 hypothetical protein [Priestia megaterium]